MCPQATSFIRGKSVNFSPTVLISPIDGYESVKSHSPRSPSRKRPGSVSPTHPMVLRPRESLVSPLSAYGITTSALYAKSVSPKRRRRRRSSSSSPRKSSTEEKKTVSLQTDSNDERLERLQMEVSHLEQKIKESDAEKGSIIRLLEQKLQESERRQNELISELGLTNSDLLRTSSRSSVFTSLEMDNTTDDISPERQMDSIITNNMVDRCNSNQDPFTITPVRMPRKDVSKYISDTSSSEDRTSLVSKLRNLSRTTMLTTSTRDTEFNVLYPQRRNTATSNNSNRILHDTIHQPVVISDDECSSSSDSVEFLEEITI